MKTKKHRLPKKFWEKWKPELLSEKYKQTIGMLHDSQDGGYCCLGVAAKCLDIPDKDMHLISTPRNLHDEYCDQFPSELLTNRIAGDLVAELVNLNDEQKKTFPEIAEWIENNVELYDEEE